jgi:hypothetical protein
MLLSPKSQDYLTINQGLFKNAQNTLCFRVRIVFIKKSLKSYLFIILDVPEISIERVYALYCGFKYGLTVKDWMEEQQVASLHVDER